LEIISFKSNKIKTIANDIFYHLENLESVSLKDNDCIDEEWTDDFEEMNKKLQESCSSSTFAEEETIFTTMISVISENNDETFSSTCNFIEKFWQYSEKAFFTCSIADPILNSNYFLPHNINNEKVEAFESAKESKFLPRNLNILSSLVEMNVENTQLQSISGMLFKNLSALKRMSFSGNEVNVVETNTFLGLDELNELDLSEGEIRFIEDGAFDGLKSLLLLNLAGNKLNYLASTIFDKLTQLQHISLEHNHLTYLNEDLFHRSSQLINIWLNGNKISSLSSASLSHLSELRLVDLQVSE
jgi:Leucine-rich repeat (LRR) protein